MEVAFHKYAFESEDLFHNSRCTEQPWPISWTRIEIPVPLQHWNGPHNIANWIEKNIIGGRWGYFIRQPAYRSGEDSHYTMILGFERENDALMFKLLGGHEAYEDEE